MNPSKFQNKTNGVTPRRWIRCANPALSAIYDKYLECNEDWLLNCEMLLDLESRVKDKTFREEWREMKRECKEKLAKWVKENCGVEINVNTLFDVQIKRIHEYKRQFMNALYIVHRYLELKEMSEEEKKK